MQEKNRKSNEDIPSQLTSLNQEEKTKQCFEKNSFQD